LLNVGFQTLPFFRRPLLRCNVYRSEGLFIASKIVSDGRFLPNIFCG
jgi:hypothetical protein